MTGRAYQNTVLTPLTLALILSACGGGGGGSTTPLSNFTLSPLTKASGAHARLSAVGTDDQGTALDVSDDVKFFTIAENTMPATAPERQINAALTVEEIVAYDLTVKDARNTPLNSHPFVIDQSTGIVSFENTIDLDYETEPAYKLTVTLEKAGFHPASILFEVRLTDEDEVPIVTGTDFVLTIRAGRTADASQIADQFADPEGGDLTYEFRAAVTTGITINENTGAVMVADSVTAGNHTLVIIAKDGANNESAPQTFTLNVIVPLIATATANEAHTGSALNGYHVSFQNSNAGVTINLLANTLSGGHATNDTLSNIQNLTGSAHADTLTGNANANILDGGAGGADILTGGAGNDIFVLSMDDNGRGDDVTDFSFGTDSGNAAYHGDVTGGNDRIRIDVDSADKTAIDNANSDADKLTALIMATDLRIAQAKFLAATSNDGSIFDTVIFDTKGTPATNDDDLLMVLIDFTPDLTIDMFQIEVI